MIEKASDFWFINSLVTVVAESTMTEGAYSIYRQVAPIGFATPYHTHAAYSESFYVPNGEVTFFRGGERATLGEGGFIHLPGICPHGFRVGGDGSATMIIVSSAGSTFGAFVREMGQPATSHELPRPSRPDHARLGALSAKYGSTVLGPLPE